MNQEHLRICSSPEWASFVETELLPWALGDRDLGDEVLEIGPGPGLTTDVLRRRVARLTAVEIDDALAHALCARLAGSNVDVVHANGTELPIAAGRFSAATVFTMLHHLPSVALQDQLFSELRRVLRSEAVLVGTDSLETASRRELHAGDIYTPVDPSTLKGRLTAVGFVDVIIDEIEDRFRFIASVPATS